METANIIFWIVVAAVMFAVEAATVNLVSIWFAGGAIAAVISVFCGASIGIQVAVFLIVSGVLLACLYPFAKKLLASKKRSTSPNFDRVINMTALVTEAVDNINGLGAVKVDGKTWSARSTSGETIEEGALVTVDRIEGVKLYVTKK